jgi:neutral ceramidase
MAEQDEFQAGAGYMVITPPIGVELGGYGFYLNRKATLVRRNLHARALVLAQGEERVAIITADLLALPANVVAETRARVALLTDIPAENVLLACTHTHSGPATLFLHGCGEPDPAYMTLLPRYLASAVSEACYELGPVTVCAGAAEVNGFALNRVNPLSPIDTTLQTLEFVFEDAPQRYVLFSFGCHPVATPPHDTAITDDFPGCTAYYIENQHLVDHAQFLPGSFGDVNPIRAHTDHGEIQRASRILMGATMLAMGQATEVESLHPLRCVERVIDLPLAPPTLEDVRRRRDDNRALQAERDPLSHEGRMARFWMESCAELLFSMAGEPDPWLERLKDAQKEVTAHTGRTPRLPELAAALDLPSASVTRLLRLQQEFQAASIATPASLPCPVQAVQIGDIVILAHPAELFAGLGLEIKQRSPFQKTFVVGCANGYLGYLPDMAEFTRRGYAADTVPYMLNQFPFASHVGRVFVEACVEFLEDLHRGN